ncbi:MAG: sugar phosphate isomerase/epimerase [Acidobacteria bacterium]|nr:sugar phosphate isomerase/epimerase [Acidobacteriota bacterium]MBI3661867.1 sugar phosphate isomerase/epimerase [Acidobacteriota bacterium]
MQRVLSTYLFVGQKLTPGLLAEIERAGIPAVELFCARPHFEYRSMEAVRELKEWFAEHELRVHSVHSPTSRDQSERRESTAPISIAEPERVRRIDAVDEVKRALELAEQIPFRYLVQHLGGREPMDERRKDAAFNSLEHLAVFAKHRGVTIALENTPGELATPANLRHFIADTRLHDLRVCFDTGHAHMEEGVERSYETVRDLVVTTHVHDNRGDKDEHLLPYEGTIDWDATLKAFGHAPAAENKLPMVLELKDSAVGGVQEHNTAALLDQVNAAFDKLKHGLAAKAD